MGYSDRIVGLERVRAGDLLANEANWRTHPDSQVSALRGLLSDVGWAQALLAYRSNGDLKLIDGHLRAGLDPDEQVPVLVLDVDEAEAEKLLVSIDPLAAMAEADSQALRSLLERVETADAGLGALLADLNAQAAPKQGRTDPDDVPEGVELRTKRGDLWLLGQHRLLCGDSTLAADVERLLNGDLALMVYTDPPYGVDYDGGATTPRERLEGDHVGTDIYQEFLASVSPFTHEKAPLYVWFADIRCWEAADALREAGWTIRAMLIWNKLQAHFGALGAQYKHRFEPFFYCVRGPAFWYGPTNEVSVWDQKQPTRNEFHPTQKPVELVERALANSSRPGDIVLDPFLGSGTTVIASEQLHRRCYAVEIDPCYCDVAVARWEQFTGEQAVLA